MSGKNSVQDQTQEVMPSIDDRMQAINSIVDMERKLDDPEVQKSLKKQEEQMAKKHNIEEQLLKDFYVFDLNVNNLHKDETTAMNEVVNSKDKDHLLAMKDVSNMGQSTVSGSTKEAWAELLQCVVDENNRQKQEEPYAFGSEKKAVEACLKF